MPKKTEHAQRVQMVLQPVAHGAEMAMCCRVGKLYKVFALDTPATVLWAWAGWAQWKITHPERVQPRSSESIGETVHAWIASPSARKPDEHRLNALDALACGRRFYWDVERHSRGTFTAPPE